MAAASSVLHRPPTGNDALTHRLPTSSPREERFGSLFSYGFSVSLPSGTRARSFPPRLPRTVERKAAPCFCRPHGYGNSIAAAPPAPTCAGITIGDAGLLAAGWPDALRLQVGAWRSVTSTGGVVISCHPRQERCCDVYLGSANRRSSARWRVIVRRREPYNKRPSCARRNEDGHLSVTANAPPQHFACCTDGRVGFTRGPESRDSVQTSSVARDFNASPLDVVAEP